MSMSERAQVHFKSLSSPERGRVRGAWKLGHKKHQAVVNLPDLPGAGDLIQVWQGLHKTADSKLTALWTY